MRLLAVALLLALAGGPARAEPDAAAQDQARELARQAKGLAEDGDHAAALDKLRAAYRLFPSPKLLVNIGTALHNLGRDGEAVEAYEEYLRATDIDDEHRKEVEAIVADLKAHLARVQITVGDNAASVMIDTRALHPTGGAATVYVEPGPHTVVAQKPGAAPVFRMVALKAGSNDAIALDLTPPPVSAPSQVTIIQEKPERPGLKLIAAGGAVLGFGYLAALLGAVYGLVHPCGPCIGTEYAYSLIPVFGMFISAGIYGSREPPYAGTAWGTAALDVAIQGAGLGMLIAGIKQSRAHPRPAHSLSWMPNGHGLTIAGSF